MAQEAVGLTELSLATSFSILSLSRAINLIFFSNSGADSDGGLELTSSCVCVCVWGGVGEPYVRVCGTVCAIVPWQSSS